MNINFKVIAIKRKSFYDREDIEVKTRKEIIALKEEVEKITIADFTRQITFYICPCLENGEQLSFLSSINVFDDKEYVYTFYPVGVVQKYKRYSNEKSKEKLFKLLDKIEFDI